MSDGYDEAVRRVQAAACDHAGELDLSGLGLEQLPPELAQLSDLTRLDLSGNWLASLPPWLAGFRSLTTLFLSGNQLAQLPPWLGELTALTGLFLAENQLAALPESLGRLIELTGLFLDGNGLVALPESLGELTALTTLDLAGNRLAVLPESLGRLKALFSLDLARNRLTALPDSLAELTALTGLDLAGNQLAALPESLGRLIALRDLDLARNQLTALPESLGNLTALTGLYLGDNQLATLPDSLGRLRALMRLDLSGNRLAELPESLGDLTELGGLFLDGNRLTSPPPSICSSGTRAVLGFLRALRQGSERQWSSKLLLVGEAAVGKTSISNALRRLPHNPGQSQTHGVDVANLRLEHPDRPGTMMDLNMWDFGGQLEYRATQRFYLTDRSLFLLVWNSRRGWRAGGQVEAWLQAISSAAPASPILIVATHCSESVADLDENDLYLRYPRIKGILRVDCKDGDGISKLREQVARHAADLPLMGQLWPLSWTTAGRRLAAEPGRYISTRRAAELLEESGVDEEAARSTLVMALHDRGEILHFARDPELRDILMLQPVWVDTMITRVLDSQEVADRGGILSREHRGELWHDLDDPGLYDKLTAMMERFDLAYRIDTPDHEDVTLVVERLPAGAPPNLPARWDEALLAPGASELRISYWLGSRQPGVPSWFIAREHRFTTGTSWARGVLLRHHGAASDAWALLQDNGQDQPTVRLTVRGTAPYVFYSILDEAFTSILADRYPGIVVKPLIPCICADGTGAVCVYEFEHSTARQALQRQIQLQCQVSLDSVDPRRLLIGLRVPDQESALARIESALAEHDTRIESKVDGIAAGIARIEHSQLLVLDTVRDLLRHRAEQGTHCPSIFTLVKTKHATYQLSLYCEHPDAPHLLPDGAGVYTFTKLPDWLRRYAPYLRLLLTGLKHGMPLIGPALAGVFGKTLSEATKAQLELSCSLLEDLSVPGDLPRELDPAGRRPRTADFARLRQALVKLDPDFGGLRERELPESQGIVYVCHHHRETLRYPAQAAP